MLLTDYLDSIENTEQEQKFLQEISELKEPFEQASKVPVVGKLMKALVALGDSESIEEFKQSAHYAGIKGYDITFNDKGHFSINPGAEQGKKAAIIFVAIVAGLLLLWLCLRRRR